jgi:phosphoserine aminotransferase
MNAHGNITIPESLLPHDGRFGSGPSRVLTEFVDDLAATAATYLGTSHRRAGVRDVVASIREGLSNLYDLPDDYEVVLGLGGATAFWDAAAFGLIQNRSAHFVCGEFSEKFAAVTRGAPHLDAPVVVASEYGTAPEPEEVMGVDAVAYIHNETSTGVIAPFDRFGDEIVLVDATSVAGVVPVDTSRFDAYYFSPQKALGSEGGLWIAILSPAATERIGSIGASGRPIPRFLSLATALENSRKNQTYNTPALATLYFLERQIDLLNASGGLERSLGTACASSKHLYSWAEASSYASPFVSQERFRSPTVVTIDIHPDVSADEIARTLRSNGIVDVEGYRKLCRNQIRIATFPNIPTSDIEALTNCIDYVAAAL